MCSDCSQIRTLPIIPMSLILEFTIVGFVPLVALPEIGGGTLPLPCRLQELTKQDMGWEGQ